MFLNLFISFNFSYISSEIISLSFIFSKTVSSSSGKPNFNSFTNILAVSMQISISNCMVLSQNLCFSMFLLYSDNDGGKCSSNSCTYVPNESSNDNILFLSTFNCLQVSFINMFIMPEITKSEEIQVIQ